ncbi:MAG: hypothetical protein PHY12_13715 [Eubacteriales bacterium]|nr:hypothetical protein [Eubacteriales bacterium]
MDSTVVDDKAVHCGFSAFGRFSGKRNERADSRGGRNKFPFLSFSGKKAGKTQRRME